jgi:hypothetical protein
MVAQTDAVLSSQRSRYLFEAMEYVQLLQEVEERKKFEFVEIVSIIYCYLLNLNNMHSLYYHTIAE